MIISFKRSINWSDMTGFLLTACKRRRGLFVHSVVGNVLVVILWSSWVEICGSRCGATAGPLQGAGRSCKVLSVTNTSLAVHRPSHPEDSQRCRSTSRVSVQHKECMLERLNKNKGTGRLR